MKPGRPGPYADMTVEDFDTLLVEEIDNTSTAELLSIPGVYEILSEHFNNDVLDAWAAKQEDDSEDDTDD